MRLQALTLLVGLAGTVYGALNWSIVAKDVYRFWPPNPNVVADGDFFYAFEDLQYNDDLSLVHSLVPLRELVHRTNYRVDGYLYTTDAAEVTDLVGPTFDPNCNDNSCTGDYWYESRKEKIYVWPSDGPGRVRLHRFSTGSGHFYTINFNEGIDAGFTEERMEAWVLPPSTRDPPPNAKLFLRLHH